jgi:hypothetical protein
LCAINRPSIASNAGRPIRLSDCITHVVVVVIVPIVDAAVSSTASTSLRCILPCARIAIDRPRPRPPRHAVSKNNPRGSLDQTNPSSVRSFVRSFVDRRRSVDINHSKLRFVLERDPILIGIFIDQSQTPPSMISRFQMCLNLERSGSTTSTRLDRLDTNSIDEKHGSVNTRDRYIYRSGFPRT